MAKTPTEVRSLARSHTEAAIKCLAGLMNEKKVPPTARVQAATVLLERGWGKPTQPIAGDETAPLIMRIERVIVEPGIASPNAQLEGDEGSDS